MDPDAIWSSYHRAIAKLRQWEQCSFTFLQYPHSTLSLPLLCLFKKTQWGVRGQPPWPLHSHLITGLVFLSWNKAIFLSPSPCWVFSERLCMASSLPARWGRWVTSFHSLGASPQKSWLQAFPINSLFEFYHMEMTCKVIPRHQTAWFTEELGIMKCMGRQRKRKKGEGTQWEHHLHTLLFLFCGTYRNDGVKLVLS